MFISLNRQFSLLGIWLGFILIDLSVFSLQVEFLLIGNIFPVVKFILKVNLIYKF